jgi:hypothetical protein
MCCGFALVVRLPRSWPANQSGAYILARAISTQLVLNMGPAACGHHMTARTGIATSAVNGIIRNLPAIAAGSGTISTQCVST